MTVLHKSVQFCYFNFCVYQKFSFLYTLHFFENFVHFCTFNIFGALFKKVYTIFKKSAQKCKVYKNENLVHSKIICALFGTKVHTTAALNLFYIRSWPVGTFMDGWNVHGRRERLLTKKNRTERSGTDKNWRLYVDGNGNAPKTYEALYIPYMYLFIKLCYVPTWNF